MASEPAGSNDRRVCPDGTSLLPLISTHAFSGIVFSAIRELLQNAFDSVREKIARKRLALPSHEDPADPQWETFFGEQERVVLTLERRPYQGLFLICEDTGAGFTEETLNGLLRPGQPTARVFEDLKGQCGQRGFLPDRAARFGNGWLSYFMMAERIVIESRRDPLCGDSTPVTRKFEITGLSEPAEISSHPTEPDQPGGTRVTWKPKDFLCDSQRQLTLDLIQYLGRTLVRIPCVFTYKLIRETASFGPGWVRPVGSDCQYLRPRQTIRRYTCEYLQWRQRLRVTVHWLDEKHNALTDPLIPGDWSHYHESFRSSDPNQPVMIDPRHSLSSSGMTCQVISRPDRRWHVGLLRGGGEPPQPLTPERPAIFGLELDCVDPADPPLTLDRQKIVYPGSEDLNSWIEFKQCDTASHLVRTYPGTPLAVQLQEFIDGVSEKNRMY